MSLESLARTIAKARHGTDAMWANYMNAAEAVQREVVEACARLADERSATFAELMKVAINTEQSDRQAARSNALRNLAIDLRALIASPSDAQ